MANQISKKEKQLIQFLEGQLLNTEAFLRQCSDKRSRLQETLQDYHTDSKQYSEVLEKINEVLDDKNDYFFRHLWLKAQLKSLKSSSDQRYNITGHDKHILRVWAEDNQ